MIRGLAAPLPLRASFLSLAHSCPSSLVSLRGAGPSSRIPLRRRSQGDWSHPAHTTQGKYAWLLSLVVSIKNCSYNCLSLLDTNISLRERQLSREFCSLYLLRPPSFDVKRNFRNFSQQNIAATVFNLFVWTHDIALALMPTRGTTSFNTVCKRVIVQYYSASVFMTWTKPFSSCFHVR